MPNPMPPGGAPGAAPETARPIDRTPVPPLAESPAAAAPPTRGVDARVFQILFQVTLLTAGVLLRDFTIRPLQIALAIGTEVDCCAYLAARHFGLRSFGTLFGTLNGLMLFGNGIAPVLANHVYDVTKSYDSVLWFQIPACLGTAVLFLLLGPYPAFPTEQEAPAATA